MAAYEISAARRSFSEGGLSPRSAPLHYVYILQSLSHPGQFYMGLSDDPQRRLGTHNAGQSLHTAKFKPWRLISAHWFDNPEVAAAFERYLKSGSGRGFAKRRQQIFFDHASLRLVWGQVSFTRPGN